MNAKGIVDRSSNHSVEQTVERLKETLRSKGRHLVRADRSQRRSGEGGNENATPLMQAAPKVLEQPRVHRGAKNTLPQELIANIAIVEALALKAAE